MTIEDRIDRLADSRRVSVALVYNWFHHTWSVNLMEGHDTETHAGYTAGEALSKAEHMSGLSPPD